MYTFLSATFWKKNKGYFASEKEFSTNVEHLYELQAVRAKPSQMRSDMIPVMIFEGNWLEVG